MKTDTITLHQFFYGHDGAQYCVLGSSDNSINAPAARLCEAVGTPVEMDFVPFLLSAVIDGRLYMIYVQQGERDLSNRRTLFFSALVAQSEAEASAAGINAFSLLDNQLFQAKPPASVEPLEARVPLPHREPPAPEFSWNRQPLTIAVSEGDARRRSYNELLHSLLKSDVNRVAWSAYSFQPLPEMFTLYALSPRSVLPQRRRCCDEHGKELTSASSREASVSSSTQFADGNSFPREKGKPSGKPFSVSPLGTALIISLAVNLALFFWIQFRSPAPAPLQTETTISEADKEKIRTEYLNELRSQFPAEMRFERDSWDTEKGKNLKRKNIFSNPEEKNFADKVEAYIDFVNSHIL